MPESVTIRADGSSPLTRYVSLLVRVPDVLERLMKRDAEAIRVLTSPGLHEAMVREERRYWDRYHENRTGEIVLSPRIWTRRDEQRVNMLNGLRGGWRPVCRVARYLHYSSPRQRNEQLFRLAFNEARQDGIAGVLAGKLDRAREVFDQLVSVASSIAQDHCGEAAFCAAKWELGPITCELMNYTKEPKDKATEPPDEDAAPQKPSWDRELGKLWYDGREIKSVRSVTVAKNVAKILDVFEEEGWPTRIDDPLDQSKDQQRLHEAIRRLNDNLSAIRFRADGTGEGIVWETTAQEPPRD